MKLTKPKLLKFAFEHNALMMRYNKNFDMIMRHPEATEEQVLEERRRRMSLITEIARVHKILWEKGFCMQLEPWNMEFVVPEHWSKGLLPPRSAYLSVVTTRW